MIFEFPIFATQFLRLIETSVPVGTLESGYVHSILLPRIPQIQSTSKVESALTSQESRDTCYLQIAWIPTWSDLNCFPEGFGMIPIGPFFPLVV